MSLAQLTALDYLFLAVLIISTGVALTKGLVRELISLGALVAGFVLASFYYPRVASLFADLARTEAVANLIGFLLVFLGMIAIGAVVAFVVNRFVKMASLEWFDRVLGGVFGFLRGWAVASVIVLALVAFPARHEAISRSYLAPYLLAGARAAALLVPQDLRDRFRAEYKKVLDAWSVQRSAT